MAIPIIPATSGPSPSDTASNAMGACTDSSYTAKHTVDQVGPNIPVTKISEPCPHCKDSATVQDNEIYYNLQQMINVANYITLFF